MQGDQGREGDVIEIIEGWNEEQNQGLIWPLASR